MKYTLQRFEKHKNKSGNVTDIFIALHVDDELGGDLIQEHWLTMEEKTAVVLAEANLRQILLLAAAKGTLKLEDQVANKPQPSEMADKVKRDRLFSAISAKEIDDEVTKLKKERVR